MTSDTRMKVLLGMCIAMGLFMSYTSIGIIQDELGKARGLSPGVFGRAAPLRPRPFAESLEEALDVDYASRRFEQGLGKEPPPIEKRKDMSQYTPIAVELFKGINDAPEKARVTLCKLDWDLYHQNPQAAPMFRVLVAKSACEKEGNSVVVSAGDLFAANPAPAIASGFIFHESRVGSTLLANILASDRENRVFSESAPVVSILRCSHCAPRVLRWLLRVVMGRMSEQTVGHKRTFFKFQSALTRSMRHILAAFPTTPYLFLHRNPIEVLASHLPMGDDTLKSNCLKSRVWPPQAVLDVLDDVDEIDASTPQYCAAHVAVLLKAASENMAPDGMSVVLDYKQLPGIFLDKVLPKHFSYIMPASVKGLLPNILGAYSKGFSAGKQTFTDDSKEKRARATAEMRRWSGQYLDALYKELSVLGERTLEMLDEEQPQEKFGSGQPSSWEFSLHVSGEEEQLIKRYEPYPELLPLPKFLREWPPDNAGLYVGWPDSLPQPDVPAIPGINEGTLERFDYQNHTAMRRATLLRTHEVPFMLTRVPNVDEVVKKWASHEYIQNQFGRKSLKVTTSTSNHFMYYSKQAADRQSSGYSPPTGLLKIDYADFHRRALESNHLPVDSPHYYLQLNGDRRVNPWIYKDLTSLQPKESFFMGDKSKHRGINCRFGSRGIIAEAHYDGGRNFVAMLKGAKRYVILPPSECPLMYLYPRTHPEARHSALDWSNFDEKEWPAMANAKAAQVVVRAGEILYIPSHWFHYIVSTGVSIQCNSRSGQALRGRRALAYCGNTSFYDPEELHAESSLLL